MNLLSTSMSDLQETIKHGTKIGLFPDNRHHILLMGQRLKKIIEKRRAQGLDISKLEDLLNYLRKKYKQAYDKT